MKQIIIVLFIFLFGMFPIGAETVTIVPFVNIGTLLPGFDWVKIVCEISPKKQKPKGRSTIYVPELYQSEEYLSVQSEYVDYGNVRITVTDAQGSVVKDDVIQVEAGGENLYYIGDLDGGTYEVAVEFDDFILSGTVEI